jgi:hypothetical protein
VGFGDQKPAIAWTGSEFAMVWEAFVGVTSGDLDLYFRRISTAGELIGLEIRLTDTGAWFHPRIAWTGSEFGVVFGIPVPALFFSRVNPVGEVVRRDVRLTDFSMDSDWPVITWTGSEFGVVWLAGPESGERTVTFNLLDGSGDIRYEALHVAEPRSGMTQPALEWTGSEFGIVWWAIRNNDDCLSDPIGPDCVGEAYFSRVGLCD